jgi:hypothetical protein
MSMKPTPTDDAFALLAIAVGFASNAAFTMALFHTPPVLLDSRVLEPARWEESAVYRMDFKARALMAGPEDERTGWLPVAEPPEVIWEFRAR